MVVKVTALIKKAEGITTEQFHKHWSEQHGNVWLSIGITRANVLKYSQFHCSPAMTSQMAAKGATASGFDGGAEFWAEKLEDIMAIFEDKEYWDIVVPDELKFLDRENMVFMVGTDDLKWENGQKVGA